MDRKGTRTFWIPVVALALGLLAATARAQEPDTDDAVESAPAVRPRSDAVYLIDVSGSMRKNRALRRAKELLNGLLDRVVQPGTQVAVIPFGSGVHGETRFEVPTNAAGAARARQQLTETIDALLPRDTYTYLFEALSAGLETLMEFKQANPGHSRHIVLVSDGKQLVPRGEKSTTLRKVLEHFMELKFRPGEDWFVWYAHIGAPDPVLKQALERTGAGQTVPLDRLASLNWAVTRFDTNVIHGGRKLPGNWSHRQRLTAQTDASGIGRKVFFQIVGKDLPKGMSLRVEPTEKEMTGETTVFDLEVDCKGAQGGTYEATILVSGESGGLHWVEPTQMRFAFDVLRGEFTASAGELDFGRILPGASASQTLGLDGNKVARIAGGKVAVEIVDVPEGVEVTLDKKTLGIGEQVGVTVAVPADAGDGDYECRLRLVSGRYADVDTAEVRLVYRVGYGKIVLGGDKLDFAGLVPGREAKAELSFTPDSDTAELGPQVKLAVTGDLPRGIQLDLPPDVKLDGPRTLPVTVRVPADLASGTYTGELHLSAPTGVQVEPATLPITIRVVAPATISLPPVVDLGDVPLSRARTLEGVLEVTAPEQRAGGRLELVATDADETVVEPPVAELKAGANALTVRLKTTDVAAGERKARFDVYLSQDGTRSKVGAVAFRWRVRESFFRVQNWAGPAAVTSGTSEVTANLVVESSADLAGKKVHLAQLLPDLVPGMAVTLTPTEVTLQGGLQTIPVRLKVEGARAGTYKGELSVGLRSRVEGVEPTALPLALDVAGATVHVTLEGGLKGLRPNDERAMTLVITATGVPTPVALDVAFDRRGLPEAIAAEVPATVQVTKPVTRVPLRFVTADGAPSGSWRPRFVIKAQTDGIAVSPEAVTVPAELPPPQPPVVKERTVVKERAVDSTATALWVGIAAGVVVLIGLAAFVLGRRGGPGVVHIPVPSQPSAEWESAAYDDEYAIDDEAGAEDPAVADTYTEGGWVDEQE